MNWRQSLLYWFGPGVFTGASLGDWLRLLRDNFAHIDPRFWPRAVSATVAGAGNSVLGWYERRRYAPHYEAVAVAPPVFVLGHYRSGTTHVHNLLCQDRRFGYPNLFQVLYPHTFLSAEPLLSRLMGRLVPATREFDNVRLGWEVPYEDEFATCAASLLSPYMSMAFPRREAVYDRYLTFRDVEAAEVERWRQALTTFLKKLTWKYAMQDDEPSGKPHGKPLVLKSPPHTARIRLLLQAFPGSKFVHVRRNPYAVFQSTRHMVGGWERWYWLQRRDPRTVEARVIRVYREMYDAFFEQRGLVPAGHFHELCFEELEKDPLGEMRKLYEALGLPDFQAAEPDLRRYLDSLTSYRKNTFPDLPPDLRRRLASEWKRCFEEWGYPF